MSWPEFHNSAVIRAPERLVLRRGRWQRIAIGVRYGLMLDPAGRPVLIDTGYGPRATEMPGRSAMLRFYGRVLGPQLVREELPLAVLARHGYGAGDVAQIVLTHFHPDHVAALRDFPAARILASGAAWRRIAAMRRHQQLRHAVFAELLPPDLAARLDPLEERPEVAAPLGLGTGRDVFGDGNCIAIELPGHALGHFGLVWPKRERPLLYAVDTQWLSAAVLEERLPRGAARLVYADEDRMRESAARVRRFAEAGGEVLFCHERVQA
ncbi:MBL fold metallo-hydrolase [Devosia sp.]|uniref:MBL fold metallo-hydrolase n=1 Tax=Devosia sp. TaxID=1871048 RepID=UPI0035B370B6